MKIEPKRSWSAQEHFWAGEFGEQYILRNSSKQLLASNLHFFSKALANVPKPTSCMEFGANVGMNLKALELLFPEIEISAVEINSRAAGVLSEIIGASNVFEGSLLDFNSEATWDLCIVKGVLIHVAPENLAAAYQVIHQACGRYLLLAEYYSPYPISVEYRGHADKLFKRDFAGEFLDMFSDFRLINYGFGYRRDIAFPEDDINWFLLERVETQFLERGDK